MTNEYIFSERNPESIKQATLCFLVKNGHVLLAMKKRGFATGLWNGLGGKVQKGEEIENAAYREAFEEALVRVEKGNKVALLHFYFPDDPEKAIWNQDVHVFIIRNWVGEPKETEEMRPEWFELDKIPYKTMWEDDVIWLPLVLNGQKIEAWFAFDGKNKIIAQKIQNIEPNKFL